MRRKIQKEMGLVTEPIIVVLRPLAPPLPLTDNAEDEEEEEEEEKEEEEEEEEEDGDGRSPRAQPPESGRSTCSTV